MKVVNVLRQNFPILQQLINGKPMIYFDNAATTHKPQQVIDSLVDFYLRHNSNIHRGIHAFGEQATSLYEEARGKIAKHIGADPSEIVFTRGTTESINFVATAWGMEHVASGDNILISALEHHANLLPWQQCAKMRNATLSVIPVTADGLLILDDLDKLITPKTKIVAVTHVSNVLGTHTEVEKIVQAAKAVGARVLVDAAQSAPHQKINVKEFGCDFCAFSGHKMLGPTGIGVLYINKELHDELRPYHFGGGMVFEADYQDASWVQAPYKFEAGTPPIAEAIGFGVAIDYLNNDVDLTQLPAYEAALCRQAIDGLSQIKGLHILGPIEQLRQKGHLVSFTLDGVHAHDTAAYLNAQGVCIRAGHHCAQPLARRLGIDASIRASFYCYNTPEEVDQFLKIVDELACNKDLAISFE